jgi:hypothetical protein
VRYRGNDYSVPTEYGHRQVLVKGYVHEVVIACGSEVIARHPRSYERETWSSIRCTIWRCWNRRHARWIRPRRWRAGSCRSASPTAAAAGSAAEEARQPRVCAGAAADGDLRPRGSNSAIEDALQLGTISFDAVKHLLLCRIERRPPRLDMENYPHLPLAQVRTTQAADYMSACSVEAVRMSGADEQQPPESRSRHAAGAARTSSEGNCGCPPSCASTTRWRGSAPSRRWTIRATCCA